MPPTQKNQEGFTRTAMEAAALNGDQSGKVFLVTGAYSGIGVETVRALVAHKGQCILAGRDAEKMKEFVTSLKDSDMDMALIDGDGPACDLGDLNSVKEFAAYVLQKYTKLDVVILNAGVMGTPGSKACLTQQDLEYQVGINVVGHYLLALKLLPITARQVWLSSNAHSMQGAQRFQFGWFQDFKSEVHDNPDAAKTYDPMWAYQQSKLGDILLAKEFAKRHEEAKLEACSVHPGVIQTNLGRNLPGWMHWAMSGLVFFKVMKTKTVEQGAATTVTCATLQSQDFTNGAYYDDCQVGTEAGNAKFEEDGVALYDLCDKLTKAFQ